MLSKLCQVYIYFFKSLALANLGVSFFAVSLVQGREEPTDWVGAYILAVLLKLAGYGLSIVIEKWFFARHRAYFFKNMGLGYRHIFGFLIGIDAVLLVLTYWIWNTVANFL